jgi:hypothetical protein
MQHLEAMTFVYMLMPVMERFHVSVAVVVETAWHKRMCVDRGFCPTFVVVPTMGMEISQK